MIHATPDLKEQKEALPSPVRSQTLARAVTKQVALKAVAADGTALMFVSENMKQDKESEWFSPPNFMQLGSCIGINHIQKIQ